MNWKLIGRGLTKPDLRKKVIAVFGILIAYRVLAAVPLPIAEPEQLKQIIENLRSVDDLQLLSFINVLSGGALSGLSIMLVGVGPYITASIIFQILTKAIPKLEELSKDGEMGRRKINQYTRMLAFPLAIVQSIGSIYFVRQIVNQVSGFGDITAGLPLSQWVLMVSALTGGAMILMWMGELITERGIGNGMSLLITVGIVSQLPLIASSLYTGLVSDGSTTDFFGLFTLPVNNSILTLTGILLFSTVMMTLFVVYLNEAIRPIKLSYAKKTQGNRTYSDVSSTLPVKLITAGVIPIIFAVSFLSVPQLAGNVLSTSSNERVASIASKLELWFSSPGTNSLGLQLGDDWTTFIYPVTYFVLVILFTYFYTGVVFNAKDLSESLQRQGGFIEGQRPGKDTEKFLSGTVNRLNLFGATSLGFLALTPILAQAFLGQGASQLALGGTSILILVAVALETLRQVESKALMVTYEDYNDQLDYENKSKSGGFSKRVRKVFTRV